MCDCLSFFLTYVRVYVYKHDYGEPAPTYTECVSWKWQIKPIQILQCYVHIFKCRDLNVHGALITLSCAHEPRWKFDSQKNIAPKSVCKAKAAYCVDRMVPPSF